MNTAVNADLHLTPEIVARHDVERRVITVDCPVSIPAGGLEPWMWIDQSFRYSHHLRRQGRDPQGARAAGLHAFRHHRSIPGRRKPAAPGGAAHGGPLSRGREVRALVDGAFDRERRTPMGTRFLIADRGRRRSSRSRGSLISAAIQRSSSRLLARTKFFEPIAGKMSEGVSGGHEEETTRKSSRPRAQAGSTHRLAYFRLGGEGARSGTTAMAWTPVLPKRTT
jgi:hypothetical protein